MLEFALVAPLVVLFLLAVVDFGIAVNRRVVLDHAARESARFASVGGTAFSGGGSPASCPEIEAKAVSEAHGMVDAEAVTVSYEDVNGDNDIVAGDSVKIQLNYRYELVTGLGSMADLSLDHIDLEGTADARLEYSPDDVGGC